MFPQTNASWSGYRYCNITVHPLAAWTSLTHLRRCVLCFGPWPQATASYGLSTLIGRQFVDQGFEECAEYRLLVLNLEHGWSEQAIFHPLFKALIDELTAQLALRAHTTQVACGMSKA